MTHAKVSVPKEVAEAIEVLRSSEVGHNFNEYGIIKYFAEADKRKAYPELEIVYDYFVKGSKYYPIDLMRALVNGYEVEKTPEEKVREYYTELKFREESEAFRGGSGSQHRQGWQSVEETLNILGIKIEGVNA